jgi:hypothetical protein
MDPVRNPFAPGAGNPPPELAGRSAILEQATVALQRVAAGRHSQSLILVGLRGVGKTVLLVRMQDIAIAAGYRAEIVEAHESKSLPELLAPILRSILYKLSMVEGARDAAKRAMLVLGGFVRGLKVKIDEVEYSLSLSNEARIADSGDIEADLPALFLTVGEAARAAKCPVAILIDEVQYINSKEFSALIMAIHKIGQEGHPLLVIGAGLPQIPALAGQSKSYAERLFKFPKIDALSPDDAKYAIEQPILAEGASIHPNAIRQILKTTAMYPYFLQQWGHDCWNVAQSNVITYSDVEAANQISLNALDESFFRVRFDRCTPSEKRYMRALADFGRGAYRSGDIAERLGVQSTTVGPIRAKLIRKGMIYSPSHGNTAFTVPLFDEYMRRVMPDQAD